MRWKRTSTTSLPSLLLEEQTNSSYGKRLLCSFRLRLVIMPDLPLHIHRQSSHRLLIFANVIILCLTYIHITILQPQKNVSHCPTQETSINIQHIPHQTGCCTRPMGRFWRSSGSQDSDCWQETLRASPQPSTQRLPMETHWAWHRNSLSLMLVCSHLNLRVKPKN